MASSIAHLLLSAAAVSLVARASGQHWHQGFDAGHTQQQWCPLYSQQPWTAPASAPWGVSGGPSPAYVGGQTDAGWGWSPHAQHVQHAQHVHHGHQDPPYDFHAQHIQHAQHAQHSQHVQPGFIGAPSDFQPPHQVHHEVPAQPPAYLNRAWGQDAAPSPWCGVMHMPAPSWQHQSSPTPTTGWDASWDLGSPFTAGARWARSSSSSSSSSQPPAWLRDPSLPRPLGAVLLDGGLRVPVREFRHILEHFKSGAWRQLTTDTGAKMVSDNFDEFERSAKKYNVRVTLPHGVAVSAHTYCLVVRSVTDASTRAVLEVPDGSSCPLGRLADRADVAAWMHALFPEGLRPRQHHGTPQVWVPHHGPTAAPATTTPQPEVTPSSTTPPPTTTPRPARDDGLSKEDAGTQRQRSPSPQQPASHDHPPSQHHQHHGQQRHHQRLPAIWSPGMTMDPRSEGPSNSLDHIVLPHGSGFARPR